jgi:hypothetical protein
MSQNKSFILYTVYVRYYVTVMRKTTKTYSEETLEPVTPSISPFPLDRTALSWAALSDPGAAGKTISSFSFS